MIRQIRLLVLLIVAAGFSAGAQELTVKSMYQTMEILAGERLRTDVNGANCALVKVQIPMTGAEFEGNIVGSVKFSVNEYLVYLIPGSRHLNVKCPGYKACLVDFSLLGIEGVQPKSVYMLDFSIPAGNEDNGGKTLIYDSSTDELHYEDFVYKMVSVPGGSFMMGATPEQAEEADPEETPAHQVSLSVFSIGQTEVPQWLWTAVMGNNPSRFKGAKHPVESVSWDDCQEFLQKLNAMTGQQFRLPTEAQWEYAARGGSRSKGYKYSGSDILDEVGWYDDNCEGETHEIASKSPNELGIYDMSGNVAEWCQDWYDSYSPSEEINPAGPISGSNNVFRGGRWCFGAWYCRVSGRDFCAPDYGDNYLGLRLAR